MQGSSIMYGIVSQSGPQASRTGKSPKRPYDGLTTLQLAYYLLDSEPDSKPALRPPGQRIGPGDLTETSRLPWFNMLQNLTNPEGPINSVAKLPWGRATVSQTVHIDFAPLRPFESLLFCRATVSWNLHVDFAPFLWNALQLSAHSCTWDAFARLHTCALDCRCASQLCGPSPALCNCSRTSRISKQSSTRCGLPLA